MFLKCLPVTIIVPHFLLLSSLPGPANRSDWDVFVKNMTTRWSKTLLQWLTPDHPVLLTRYEDIHRNTVHEVERMLEFLKVPYHHLDLEKKLSTGFTSFRRSHGSSLDNRKFYSRSQSLRIKEVLIATATELNKRGFSLAVDDYK